MADDTWHTNPSTHKEYQVVSTTDSRGRTGDYHVYADGSSVFVPKPDRPVDTIHGGVPQPAPAPPAAPPPPAPAPAPAAPPAPAPAAPAPAPASSPAASQPYPDYDTIAPNGKPWLHTTKDGKDEKYYVGPWDKDSQGRPGTYHVYQDKSIGSVFVPADRTNQTGGTLAPDESAPGPAPGPVATSQSAQPSSSGNPASDHHEQKGVVVSVPHHEQQGAVVSVQPHEQLGQVTTVSSGKSHTVVAGDSMSAIAHQYGVSLAALEQANPHIQNFNVIHPGEHVNIPGGSGGSGGSDGSAVAHGPSDMGGMHGLGGEPAKPDSAHSGTANMGGMHGLGGEPSHQTSSSDMGGMHGLGGEPSHQTSSSDMGGMHGLGGEPDHKAAGAAGDMGGMHGMHTMAFAGFPNHSSYPTVNSENKSEQPAEGGWGMPGGVAADPTQQAIQAVDTSHNKQGKQGHDDLPSSVA